MIIDHLSLNLNIDIEAAKLILNTVTNHSSVMHHDMRELREFYSHIEFQSTLEYRKKFFCFIEEFFYTLLPDPHYEVIVMPRYWV
jgi:hypothetical protein